MSAFPGGALPFVTFAALLRANGFAVAPEQTTDFLAAITLLGPRELADISRAGLATLAPPPERRSAYDTLFNLHFRGQAALAGGKEDDEDEVRIQHEQRGEGEPPLGDEINEAGAAAARGEALAQRRFGTADRDEALRQLSREAERRLPQRRSHRRRRARRGAGVDLRRTLREAARNDGEVLKLAHLKRRRRPRKLLLLIDVSGSMKARSEDHLRLAHALVQAVPRAEIFTFGTRLTRITRAMQLKRREQALAGAAAAVSDFDGGTRIGDALAAFLAVPRFAGYARGAAVLVLSDGLERGDASALADAVAKLSRRAWRLSWLTPLALAGAFKPQTQGLMAIERFCDDMAGGGSIPAIVDHVLGLGRAA